MPSDLRASSGSKALSVRCPGLLLPVDRAGVELRASTAQAPWAFYTQQNMRLKP